MFQFLFNTHTNKALYVLKAYLLNVAFIVPFVLFVLPHLSVGDSPSFTYDYITFGFMVFIGPALETLFMGLIIWALLKLNLSIFKISFLSALIWALLHSAQYPIWGVGVFVLFLILSISYLVWLKRSFKEAFWVTTAIHSLNNGVVFLYELCSS